MARIIGYLEDETAMVGALTDSGVLHSLGRREEFWRRSGEAGSHGTDGPVVPSPFRECPAMPSYGKVICIGLNYRAHAVEAKAPIPDVPVVFGRWHSSLCSDGDAVPLPEDTFDWEGELGVVIGRKVYRADKEESARAIFGYVAFNDLSARGFQTQTAQWTLGKNTDSSGPVSPIAPAVAVGDPAEGLRITTRVNGRIVQDARTDDLIFSVPEIIAHVSQAMTLEPGDMIVTGTPSGVGAATGEYLRVGDEVEVEIERVGRVRNRIISAPAS